MGVCMGAVVVVGAAVMAQIIIFTGRWGGCRMQHTHTHARAWMENKEEGVENWEILKENCMSVCVCECVYVNIFKGEKAKLKNVITRKKQRGTQEHTKSFSGVQIH